MSYFGNALTEFMQRKKMNQSRLAELSGVDDSKISRYRSGDQTWVSADHFEKLARAISNDAGEQAELLRARLLDECQGPGASLVRIEIAGEKRTLTETGPAYQVRLPAKIEAALQTIRQFVIQDVNVRDVILGLGNLLSEGDCRIERAATDLNELATVRAVNSPYPEPSPEGGRISPAHESAAPEPPSSSPQPATHAPKAPVKYTRPSGPERKRKPSSRKS